MKGKYQKEVLGAVVAECTSIAQVCRELGLAPLGSNFKTICKYIELHQLDTSHFKGQGWNKGLSYSEKTAHLPLEEILQKNVIYNSDRLKRRLIKAGLKENKCEVCGVSGEDFFLELHHINGDHNDNRLENLQILCMQHHHETKGFRKPKSKPYEVPEHLAKRLYIKQTKPTRICKYCGKEFLNDRWDRNRSFCSRECYHKYMSNLSIGSPNSITKEKVLEVIDNYSDITHLSQHFNVSRPTMRKILDTHGLLEDFKLKYEFKAKPVIQYDLNMNIIKEWPSLIDAMETTNVKDIHRVVSGKRRSAGGYIWRYK